MKRSRLRIITRKSPLALWQANHVSDYLCRIHNGLNVEIIGIKTEADKFLDMSLAAMGGKGAFVKELEQALLDGDADLAVHSMKDVSVDLPDGLSLHVILKREDPRDVFIANGIEKLDQLPKNAKVGTSSLRRRCQLLNIRNDLDIIDIRGNVGTRLKKLEEKKYDALILAAAGMKRLDLEENIQEYLSVDTLLPAIGQGAMGIETRSDDFNVLELLQPLNHSETYSCVTAERALNRQLEGGCHFPVAAYAQIKSGQLAMSALVGSLDGKQILRGSIVGVPEIAIQLGVKLGDELLSKGADKLLKNLLDDSER